MTQRRRNRTQWRRLVEGRPRSGLTQQAYCDRHGISLGSLRRWRQIFHEEREAGIAEKVTKPEPAQLVPVTLIGGAVAETAILNVGQKSARSGTEVGVGRGISNAMLSEELQGEGVLPYRAGWG